MRDQVGLLLLGTILVLGLIVSVAILAAMWRRRRSREKDSVAPSRRQPEPAPPRRLQRYHDEPDEDDDDGSALANWHARSRREDGGIAAGRDRSAMLAICFLGGVLVGASGMALWWGLGYQPATPAQRRSQALSVEQQWPGSTGPAIGQTASGSPAERAAAFADGLKRTLPVVIDESITLEGVEARGSLVTLGFDVFPAIGEGRLKRSAEFFFRHTACDRNLGGMRDLNEGGVEFRLKYVDENGQSVVDTRFAPKYCSNPVDGIKQSPPESGPKQSKRNSRS